MRWSGQGREVGRASRVFRTGTSALAGAKPGARRLHRPWALAVLALIALLASSAGPALAQHGNAPPPPAPAPPPPVPVPPPPPAPLPTLASLSLPAVVTSGSNALATAVLTGPSPGGIVLTVAISPVSALAGPNSVTVPFGASSVNFNVIGGSV